MSKVGQWVMEMQEDATCMTETEFVSKHGRSNIQVWDDIQEEMHGAFPNPEPTDEQIEAMYQSYLDGLGEGQEIPF